MSVDFIKMKAFGEDELIMMTLFFDEKEET